MWQQQGTNARYHWEDENQQGPQQPPGAGADSDSAKAEQVGRLLGRRLWHTLRAGAISALVTLAVSRLLKWGYDIRVPFAETWGLSVAGAIAIREIAALAAREWHAFKHQCNVVMLEAISVVLAEALAAYEKLADENA